MKGRKNEKNNDRDTIDYENLKKRKENTDDGKENDAVRENVMEEMERR